MAALAAAVIGLSIAAGCSAESSATSATSAAAGFAADAADPAAPAPQEMAQAGGGVAAPGAKSESAGSAGDKAATLPALDNRQIVRTADLQIRLVLPDSPNDPGTDDDTAQRNAITAAVSNARAQAIAAGGFVADLQQSSGSASLVIRVPVDKYDSFRSSAEQLGEVESSTESAQDVTDEYTDVTSRIASMQTSIDRLRTLLAQATDITDIIAIESELSTREAELESLQGRQAVLADQVSLATISISFNAYRAYTPTPDSEPEQGGFLGGLADGWNALVGFLTGASVVAGALLPFVPVLLVIGFAVWFVVRKTRSRRNHAARAATRQPPNPPIVPPATA